MVTAFGGCYYPQYTRKPLLFDNDLSTGLYLALVLVGGALVGGTSVDKCDATRLADHYSGGFLLATIHPCRDASRLVTTTCHCCGRIDLCSQICTRISRLYSIANRMVLPRRQSRKRPERIILCQSSWRQSRLCVLWIYNRLFCSTLSSHGRAAGWSI